MLIDFPGEMSDEAILAVMRKHYGGPAPTNVNGADPSDQNPLGGYPAPPHIDRPVAAGIQGAGRSVADTVGLLPDLANMGTNALLAGAEEVFDRIPEPTIVDAAPGVDNTANEDSLPVEYRHHPVFYRSSYPAGTIIVNTADRFLCFILSSTTAMRYAVDVSRDGFQWSGIHRITRKQEWPDWTPPPEMIVQQPYLPRFMAGGPGNPMGARALYIGTTVYRIHGTNAPETIGHAVSSGCFRLVNGEISDLYDRVAIGSAVIVQHQ